MNDLVGVALVCLSELRWSRAGELVIIMPGQEFELDEADLALGLRPDLWLASGAVVRSENWPAYEASLSEDARLALQETAVRSQEHRDEELAVTSRELAARQRTLASKVAAGRSIPVVKAVPRRRAGKASTDDSDEGTSNADTSGAGQE